MISTFGHASSEDRNAVQERSTSSMFSAFGSRFLIAMCMVLAIIPPARTIYVVATTGANCISNDDILFLSLTENMLSGAYDWRSYFRDTFINGHCCAAIQALFLILGPVTAWNQYTLCFTSITLAALRAHITAKLLCSTSPKPLYWTTLAIASWMFFSYSQISIFTTGIFAVMWQSCLLFMVLGVYVLWRFPDKLSAAITSSVLGILASWSLALALPTWLVYFAVGIVHGAHRRTGSMVALAAGAVAAFAPYCIFLLQGTEHSRKLSEQYIGLFNATFFINALGRSFANETGSKFGSLPGSELAGTFAITAFAVLTALIIGAVRLRRLLAPCFILCAWSLVILAMIFAVRSGIAPWYALIAATFWSALATASTLVLAEYFKYGANQHKRALTVIASCLILLVVAKWTWQYNKSYMDKQYYLENRTPVSASVLRNYDIAPSGYASYVFKLPGLSTTVTGKMLERNQWSVFSREQTWEMQGDAIFPLSAGYPRGVQQGGSTWIRGRNETAAGDFRSPKHLNLCVQKKSIAHWRISVPRNAKRVFLKTAIARSEGGTSDSSWFLSVKAERGQQSQMRLTDIAGTRWHPIDVDLTTCAGDYVDISFGSSSADSTVVFQYPVVQMRHD